MVSVTGRSFTSKSPKGRTWVRILVIGAVFLAVAAALLLGLPKHLSLAELRADRTVLRAFVAAHPWQSVWLYMATYCVVVALSLPGALVMTLTGGFLFGALEGGAAAVTGVSSGAIVMFLVARTAIGENLLRWLENRGGVMAKVQDHVRAHPFSALLTLRLIPAAPIWLVNIAASFVRMPLSTYALATVIGVMPSTFLYTSVGSGLNGLFEHTQPGGLLVALRNELFWPLVGLSALGALPLLWKLWRLKQERARMARALPNGPA